MIQKIKIRKFEEDQGILDKVEINTGINILLKKGQ